MVERALLVACAVARKTIFIILCCCAMPVMPVAAEVQVRWRCANAAGPTASIERTADVMAKPAARHIVVQFHDSIRPRDRAKLVDAGLTLHEYLGDNAYFASTAATGVDQGALARLGLFADANEIQANWKLDPILAAGQEPSWAIVSDDSQSDPVIGAYVVLHPDVTLFSKGVKAVGRHGAIVRATLPSIHALVIELPLSRVAELAGEDGVQYIEPALPRMEGLNNGSRELVGADLVQAAPYNLDGTGVHVMVYDVGRAARFDGFVHPDLSSHLTFGDASPFDAHSSHVAGTIGGDGTQSAGLYRGMAPGVFMSSYGFQGTGAGTFLYSNPGDLQADYLSAVANGADIANNSIGSNVCSNGLPCALTGNYGVTSALIDSIVRGSLGAPFRVVFAAGNERGCPNCPTEHVNGYHSMAPPACAKNHITVGAVNSDDDTITDFTSWGPTDDGRLKPDIVAPGCQATGDFAVTSCNTGFGVFGYAARCGTSMATPTVTGLAALLLQDFRAQFPTRPDPRNAAIKSLLAHNAVDIGNTGPDYQSGYGSVRIQPTIDFMRSGGLIEREVGHLQTVSVPVVVPSGAPELKVTIAWDDIPAAPNVNLALVNDLDLRVFSPGGVEHFPWTLDPANPAAPAVQNQADHLNNIEQVLVAAPEPGVWQIQVFGSNVTADAILPLGLQPFSMSITPRPMVCSSQGLVSLDRPAYACDDTLAVHVADCDLNTNDLTVETVTVTVGSSTEPAGESVVLTETAADSGVFSGAILLGVVNSAGVLQVTGGDTITASYTDAADGSGGVGVTVTDTSVADCLPPCDDGLFCNGLESPDGNGGCLLGTPPNCSDGVGCTIDSCNETTDTCDHAGSDALCDNGLFCDGSETCDAVLDCQAGAAPNCSDGVGCTLDACNETTDACDHTGSDALCDNGQFCDGVEACDSILGCVAGTPPCGASPCDEAIDACVGCVSGLDCNDGVPCTDDACVGGACVFTPNNAGCPDDGIFCNGLEQCDATAGCVSGGNPCGANQTCNEATATCGMTTLGEGFMFSRNADFSTDDHSFLATDTLFILVWSDVMDFANIKKDEWNLADPNGQKVKRTIGNNFDGTYTDALDLATLPSSATDWAWSLRLEDNSGHQFDPFDALTVSAAAGCAIDADCADGVFCNGVEACVAGSCQSGIPVDCGDGVACTVDTCNEVAASCQHVSDDAACDNGLFCDGLETCNVATGCQPGTDPCPGLSCDPISGSCAGCQTNPDCDDGLFCNGIETCLGGVCQPGTPVSCTDGVGCTVDVCDETTDSCTHASSDNLCDNGLFCDGVESCHQTLGCQPGAPVNCNDGLPCTIDTCNEVADVCGNVSNDALCDDGLFCNGVETCLGGVCQPGTPVNCTDVVGCTVDACNEITNACDHTASDALCDNGLFCDGVEACDSLLDCQAGVAPNCNDGVGCTVDACNEATNTCDHAASDALCDNGLFCDGVETCDSLLDCQTGAAPNCNDGVGCTVDACNETTNACDHAASDALCDNGLFCDGVETCDSLLDCQAGTPINCDDAVGCTVDLCDEIADICTHTPVDVLCDNGLFCDGVETCDSLLDCQAGTPINCDDVVGCTVDLCDEIADTCTHTAVDVLCDDGLFCDGVETCDSLLDCQAGTPVNCDDGLPCTIDTCNEVVDVCDNVSSDALCDDGLFCSGVETCVGGVCQTGVPVDCDDGLPCTVDACDDVLNACVNVSDDFLCDDGLFCNGAETCLAGICQIGLDPCLFQPCDELADACVLLLGAGLILSRDPDFSTDDRVFFPNDTMYMLIWSDQVDHTTVGPVFWEMQSGNSFASQPWINLGNGSYTAVFDLAGSPPGATSWRWQTRIEDAGGSRIRQNVSVDVLP